MKQLKFTLIIIFCIVNGIAFAQKDTIIDEEAFVIVDEMPVFPGCENIEDKDEQKLCTEKELLKYMYQNITYPIEARENGIEGLVVLQFVIDEEGKVSGVHSLRGIGGGCEEEAVRVVESMNTMPTLWTPGQQEGEKVKVRYNLPIRFKLAAEPEPTYLSTKLQEGVYTEVNQMPIFPGCSEITDTTEQRKCSEDALKKYIADNIQYPESAKNSKTEGVVGIQFIVSEFGAVMNIKIIKSMGSVLDAEAFRVINSMNLMSNGWYPGMHQGKRVKVLYTIPVEFKL